jgi:uncharacterized spore protein YtfJ
MQGARLEEMIVMTATAKDAPVLDSLRGLVDDATAGKVFGSPIQHDGVVVLPVAKVGGGAGGGSGTGPAPDGQESGGTGGGFGIAAKPLGVFVLTNGKVTWRPAVDVNRVVLGGQIVAVTALLVLRALIKAGAGRPSRERTIRQIVRKATSTKCAAASTFRRLGHRAQQATR